MYLFYIENLPDADKETEGSGGSSRKKRRKSRIKEPSVGCNGSLSRMEIINLRTELEGVHSGKISLPDAEARLKLFEREQWIVPKIKMTARIINFL